jgi:hypothetical protein
LTGPIEFREATRKAGRRRRIPLGIKYRRTKGLSNRSFFVLRTFDSPYRIRIMETLVYLAMKPHAKEPIMLSKLSMRIIGRRVKVIAWEPHEQAHRIGTITHIDSYGNSEGDIWVQVEGLDREYVFGRSQLELLP